MTRAVEANYLGSRHGIDEDDARCYICGEYVDENADPFDDDRCEFYHVECGKHDAMAWARDNARRSRA